MVASIVFTIDELRAYAAKAGLGLNFVIKEAFLFQLAEILEEYGFVMKGGTAINKGYLKGHQRFSEDLDYDTEEEKHKVRSIIHGLGWPVKREYFTRHSIGFALAYEFENVKDAVKVDFAFRMNGAYGKKEMLSDFLPLSKRVRMYEIGDLMAQKEGAFEDRMEWKDLYDLYWINKIYPNDFVIKSKEKFISAIEGINIPKTANAFIPFQTRLNWRDK
jgi:predicted nucleotidyltransferase component of viral defense system